MNVNNCQLVFFRIPEHIRFGQRSKIVRKAEHQECLAIDNPYFEAREYSFAALVKQGRLDRYPRPGEFVICANSNLFDQNVKKN